MEILSIVSFISSDKEKEIQTTLEPAYQLVPLNTTERGPSHIVFLFDSQSLKSESCQRRAKNLLQNNNCLRFCLIDKNTSIVQLDFIASNFLSLFHDIIFWPCDSAEIHTRIARFTQSTPRNSSQDHSLLAEFTPLNLIGQSPAFVNTLSLIKKVSQCDAPVFIEGETGTGKENAARAIHYLGPRSDNSFVPVNCGALPDELLESELFGHCKGAFTDAKQAQTGLVSIADGGTLFLDEIDSLSPKAQAVMLRFLQTGEFRPIGGKSTLNADARIIAASNANIPKLVKEGHFREDLMFRLNVLNVVIPPLRQRQSDIKILAKNFFQKFSETYKTETKFLSAASLQWLQQQTWPGNVRELENTMLRHFLLAEGELVHIGDIEEKSSLLNSTNSSDSSSFQAAKASAIRQFEKSYLTTILKQTAGNVSEAARVSGKERRALGKLLQKYKIDKESYYVHTGS